MLASGELALLVERLGAEPRTVAPSAASSAALSRKAQLCGVQPRAPGMRSQPAGSGRPGTPVCG